MGSAAPKNLRSWSGVASNRKQLTLLFGLLVNTGHISLIMHVFIFIQVIKDMNSFTNTYMFVLVLLCDEILFMSSVLAVGLTDGCPPAP